MKIFSVIMLLTVLASCTTDNWENRPEKAEKAEKKVINKTLPEEVVIQETILELTESIEELDNIVADESKVQVINQSYTNPKKVVNMEISYTLDEQGIITSMDLVSNDERHAGAAFNKVIDEEVVWLTLAQVIDADLTSGSSLTTESFKEAIKSQL